jgi:hypothetical protein
MEAKPKDTVSIEENLSRDGDVALKDEIQSKMQKEKQTKATLNAVTKLHDATANHIIGKFE